MYALIWRAGLPQGERELTAVDATTFDPNIRLPKHVLQHAVADHGDAVEFDRRTHHGKIEMP
jgi:hypothetical protein